MNMPCRTVDFFLGSNSQSGFVSHFSQLQDPYGDQKLYVLKGGPGTGKSSLMKALAQLAEKRETFVERIHCSSDPDSLDGVLFSDSKAAVVDGTKPHAVEPKHAGAVETIVNLLSCVDDEALEQNREEIVEISAVIAAYHKRFCDLLKCVNLLMESNRKMILPYVDTEKIKRTAERIAHREFHRRSVPKGKIQRRMLSAFTPKGLVTYENTVKMLCHRCYFINDEYRVCAPLLMELLRQKLKEAGIGCYICDSPYYPGEEIEHILIPDLDLAFLTVHKREPMLSLEPTKVIHAARFIDTEIFRLKKQRLSFYRKTAGEVLEEAISTLQRAKEAHDVLEQFYLPCVDFDQVNQLKQQLELRLERRYFNYQEK